jgi:single-stranded DNA-binding protein
MPQDAVRFGQDGAAYGSVRGKFAARFKDESGNWQDRDETWVDLQLGGPIQRFANEFQPNATVYVSGEFYVREYQTRDGGKGIAPAIRVRAFEIQPRRDKGQSQPANGNAGTWTPGQPGGFGGQTQQQPDPWAQQPAAPGGWGDAAQSSPPF